MDEKLMNKIIREKRVKFNDLPDDFDVSFLPEDTEIIVEEHFPELENEFWEEDD